MYGHRTIAIYRHEVSSVSTIGGNIHGKNSRLFRHAEVQ